MSFFFLAHPVHLSASNCNTFLSFLKIICPQTTLTCVQLYHYFCMKIAILSNYTLKRINFNMFS